MRGRPTVGAEAAVRGRQDSAGPPRLAMLAGVEFPPVQPPYGIRRTQTLLRVNKGMTTKDNNAKVNAKDDNQG